jgi:RNA-directed DNA polymerase
MLERAKEVTSGDGYQHIEYARWADDLVILVDAYRKWDWLAKGAYQRLCEELSKLDVTLNLEKTRQIDLKKEEGFNFLGFLFRRAKTKQGKWGILKTPKMEARTKLLRNLKAVFRRHLSQPIERVIYLINPILRGWVNYFRIGNSSQCFSYVRDWVEKKLRRHLMRARHRKGFGWELWSRQWLYKTLGLYSDYEIRYYQAPKVCPAQ